MICPVLFQSFNFKKQFKSPKELKGEFELQILFFFFLFIKYKELFSFIASIFNDPSNIHSDDKICLRLLLALDLNMTFEAFLYQYLSSSK